nr:DNA helicase [Tanacetum cinerariifolium]
MNAIWNPSSLMVYLLETLGFIIVSLFPDQEQQKLDTKKSILQKFFGGPTYLVLVESMKRKIEQSQFTSEMQCRITGDHVEITGTSSGVQQKAKTPVAKDVHRGRYKVPAESIWDVSFYRNVRRRLLPTFLSVSANTGELPPSIEPHTKPVDTNENRSPPNQHCIPILTVFERFRNLPTVNVESDSMSGLRTHLIKLLLDMVSPCMPVDRFESSSAVAESISIKRNAMMCVTPSEEHAVEVSLRFRNACGDDFWSFEFGTPKSGGNHEV